METETIKNRKQAVDELIKFNNDHSELQEDGSRRMYMTPDIMRKQKELVSKIDDFKMDMDENERMLIDNLFKEVK